MKLNKLFKGIHCIAPIVGGVLILSASVGHAGTMGPAVAPAGKMYVGGFGGGGGLTSGVDLSQYATAFFTEAAGGPLAVDAFGDSRSSSAWLAGGFWGYEWAERLFPLSSSWTFAPAAELEGFYIGGTTLEGGEVNNATDRLPEHNFVVNYPQKTGVFLVNALVHIRDSSWGRFHPYAGVGIGSAVVSISGASALQVAPPEAGVNHYNADTHDKAVAFAAQPKVGLSFEVSPGVSIFGEYRFVYLSPTDFTFGSTVYPTHAPTSSWEVKLGSQYYNMGTAGIRFDV